MALNFRDADDIHGGQMTPANEPNSLLLFLPLLIISALVLIPVHRILGRLGLSRWWCLIAFFPLLNFIGLWVLAFVRWPSLDSQSQTRM